MGYRSTDLYIFKNQLRETSSVGFSTNFVTIWKGIVLSFVYDEITKTVVSTSYPHEISHEEFMLMADMVYWYLNKEAE